MISLVQIPWNHDAMAIVDEYERNAQRILQQCAANIALEQYEVTLERNLDTLYARQEAPKEQRLIWRGLDLLATFDAIENETIWHKIKCVFAIMFY